MSNRKALVLHPVRSRSYVQAWPGVPSAPGRPGAHVAGKVEVRLPHACASWVRIELCRFECIPGLPPVKDIVGGQPITVWCAPPSTWQPIPHAHFAFTVPLPTDLPPSARIDKHTSISYELVATLCMRQQSRALITRKETQTDSLLEARQPIVVTKHDLNPLWMPFNFPDQRTAHVTTKEGDVHLIIVRDQHCFGPGDQIHARMALTNDARIRFRPKNLALTLCQTVVVKYPVLNPFAQAKTAKKDSTLSATTSTPLSKKSTLHPPEHTSESSAVPIQGPAPAPLVRTSILAMRTFSPGKPLKPGETRAYDICLAVPKQHALMTITTAQHIQVTTTLRLSARALDQDIVLDKMPVTLSTFPRTEALQQAIQIGHVNGWSQVPAKPPPSEGTQNQQLDADNMKQPAVEGETQAPCEPDTTCLGSPVNSNHAPSSSSSVSLGPLERLAMARTPSPDDETWNMDLGTTTTTNISEVPAPLPVESPTSISPQGGAFNQIQQQKPEVTPQPTLSFSPRSRGPLKLGKLMGINFKTDAVHSAPNLIPSRSPKETERTDLSCTSPSTSAVRSANAVSSASPSPLTWPSAEEEKLKLYHQARTQVEEHQSASEPSSRLSSPETDVGCAPGPTLTPRKVTFVLPGNPNGRNAPPVPSYKEAVCSSTLQSKIQPKAWQACNPALLRTPEKPHTPTIRTPQNKDLLRSDASSPGLFRMSSSPSCLSEREGTWSCITKILPREDEVSSKHQGKSTSPLSATWTNRSVDSVNRGLPRTPLSNAGKINLIRPSSSSEDVLSFCLRPGSSSSSPSSAIPSSPAGRAASDSHSHRTFTPRFIFDPLATDAFGRRGVIVVQPGPEGAYEPRVATAPWGKGASHVDVKPVLPPKPA